MTGIRDYAVVTAAYWGFTLSDGALRMLVLLHFHTLGYSPFQLATLFLLYEVMGMITNLAGGWLGSRYGVKVTLHAGLGLQVMALLALSALDPAWPLALSVGYVLAIQGLSGVAKDLSKMSAKSAIKLVVPAGAHSTLFKWVALLTGSKNALKGVGFFLGGLLLGTLGFVHALWLMAGCLAAVLAASVIFLPGEMGKIGSKTSESKTLGSKAILSEILSKSRAINLLSAARLFLFGARDVWFVVGLPVFLAEILGWSFTFVGAFLALWVIGYGVVQAAAPMILKSSRDGRSSEVQAARVWIFILAGATMAVAGAIHAGYQPAWALIIGLGVFGFCFAVNSALHSYLILAFSEADAVAMSVGFYYSANAAGRLLGTLLSGLAYQWAGLTGCLGVAAAMLLMAGVFTLALGDAQQPRSRKAPAE
ncbi:MAG: organoarsenical effux MFS transporter ArsJ [Proteobacteria bacterium]|nr:organoarsenical effux MFS transporter ArsJ [Pseudomonadota bacterium]